VTTGPHHPDVKISHQGKYRRIPKIHVYSLVGCDGSGYKCTQADPLMVSIPGKISSAWLVEVLDI
jgi:hypothetical protein